MDCARIQTDATERIEALMLDGSLSPLTGLSDVLLSIRRVSDDFWYDFSDDTFKSTGWTTRQQVMAETDATNDPGAYDYDFDTSAITNAAADDTYQLRVDCASAANVPQTGELKVGQFVDELDAPISGVPDAADNADAVWDEVINTTFHNGAGSAGRKLRRSALSIMGEDDLQGATINTAQLAAGAASIDGAYDPAVIYIVDGAGEKQCRLILEYDGATRTAVIDRDWKVIPSAGDTYVLYADPGREHVNEGLAQGGTASTITLNTLASADDDAYVGQTCFIRSGTGQDQARMIAAYDGTTKIATLETGYTWDVVPDTTSAYVMLPHHIHPLPDIADAVWAHSDAVQALADLAFVKHIEGGRWHLTGGQMIFYEADNVTEVARFDITLDGNDNPIERTRV